MSITEVSVRKRTAKEQLAYDMGYQMGKHDAVRHGRWVMTLYTTTSKRGRVISNKKYACTECGYSNGRKQSDYCPNCGAMMDAKNDDEQNMAHNGT